MRITRNPDTNWEWFGNFPYVRFIFTELASWDVTVDMNSASAMLRWRRKQEPAALDLNSVSLTSLAKPTHRPNQRWLRARAAALKQHLLVYIHANSSDFGC